MRGRIDPKVLERFGWTPDQVIIKRAGQVGAEVPGWLIAAFNPSQPRDQRGRWTSIGGDYSPLSSADVDEIQNAWFDNPERPLDRRREQMDAAILDYTGSGAARINRALREGGSEFPPRGRRVPLTPEERQEIRDLDRAFQYGVPLPKDTLLYRGGQTSGPVEPGTILMDKAFLSITANRAVGERFSGTKPGFYTIRVPKGTKVVPAAWGEDELILPRHTPLRVLSFKERVPFEMEYDEIEVEVVPSE